MRERVQQRLQLQLRLLLPRTQQQALRGFVPQLSLALRALSTLTLLTCDIVTFSPENLSPLHHLLRVWLLPPRLVAGANGVHLMTARLRQQQQRRPLHIARLQLEHA